MAEVEDKQLALCVNWMSGLLDNARLLDQPSIQTLAENTLAALRELQAQRAGVDVEAAHR